MLGWTSFYLNPSTQSRDEVDETIICIIPITVRLILIEGECEFQKTREDMAEGSKHTTSPLPHHKHFGHLEDLEVYLRGRKKEPAQNRLTALH